MKHAVIGAGSWGTALAIQLAIASDADVALWDHDGPRAVAMDAARENVRYLPGTRLPSRLRVTGDLAQALAGASVVVIAVPSQTVRAVMGSAAPFLPVDAVLCCASKGIEQGTHLTMDEVLAQVLPPPLRGRTTFLCGPSFAKEVAVGLPTAVVIAAKDRGCAHAAAEALHGPTFRVYDTDDVVGAELGAALKNVVAIACGVSDGLGLGLNARAAIITRGLAEIARLAVARGGNPLTLAGLAGVGDLVLTCTGDLSRNRRVGMGLGKGKTLDEVCRELGQVAEGIATARSGWELAQEHGIDMPITEQVFRLLHEGKPVAQVLMDLSARERKAERT